MIMYVSESATKSYSLYCEFNETDDKKVRQLAKTVICSDTVHGKFEQWDQLFVTVPLKAFDFAAELLTKYAQCEDITNCGDFDIDGIIDEYPELGLDFIEDIENDDSEILD